VDYVDKHYQESDTLKYVWKSGPIFKPFDEDSCTLELKIDKN